MIYIYLTTASPVVHRRPERTSSRNNTGEHEGTYICVMSSLMEAGNVCPVRDRRSCSLRLLPILLRRLRPSQDVTCGSESEDAAIIIIEMPDTIRQ